MKAFDGKVFHYNASVIFRVVSFRGQIKLEPLLDWSCLEVKFTSSNNIPVPFIWESPTGDCFPAPQSPVTPQSSQLPYVLSQHGVDSASVTYPTQNCALENSKRHFGSEILFKIQLPAIKPARSVFSSFFFFFGGGGVFWCCGRHCWVAIALWSAFCFLSSVSFVFRHLVIATPKTADFWDMFWSF